MRFGSDDFPYVHFQLGDFYVNHVNFQGCMFFFDGETLQIDPWKSWRCHHLKKMKLAHRPQGLLEVVLGNQQKGSIGPRLGSAQ